MNGEDKVEREPGTEGERERQTKVRNGIILIGLIRNYSDCSRSQWTAALYGELLNRLKCRNKSVYSKRITPEDY